MASSGPRRADLRPLNDRFVFKPFAILLLIPVVLIAAGLTALVIAPPAVVGNWMAEAARFTPSSCPGPMPRCTC